MNFSAFRSVHCYTRLSIIILLYSVLLLLHCTYRYVLFCSTPYCSRSTVLCSAVLYSVLYCTVLYWIALFQSCAGLYCTITTEYHFTVLYIIVPDCTVLYCIALHCYYRVSLCCTVLYPAALSLQNSTVNHCHDWFGLNCTVLSSVSCCVLYCTILHSTILRGYVVLYCSVLPTTVCCTTIK